MNWLGLRLDFIRLASRANRDGGPGRSPSAFASSFTTALLGDRAPAPLRGGAGHTTGTVTAVSSTDEIVERILTSYDTITVVGASSNPAKAAHRVPADLQRHGWRIIPVNPRGGTILGEPAYPTLADVPETVGLIDVFRPSLETPVVARAAVAAGATALWLQLGIVSEEAHRIAQEAGLLYVENRCLHAERRRLGLEAPTRREGQCSGRPAEARPNTVET